MNRCSICFMLFIYTFIPRSIRYMWNFGSLLRFIIIVQIITGFILVINYTNNNTFSMCLDLFFDFNNSWAFHNMHVGGASFIFILIYSHIWRNIYYSSFNKTILWRSGVALLLMRISVAFLGYVLPWGQISYWGTTVITGLVSAFPSGNEALNYILGGSVVGYQTLTRFIRLHFIIPFMIIILILTHVNILHTYASSNVLGVPNWVNVLEFSPFFFFKDTWVILILLMRILFVVMILPYVFREPENWNERDILKTPLHIQPEWYFLFAYAILRSIPNKLGGVLALVSAVFSFFFFKKHRNVLVWWIFFTTFIALTKIGSFPVEAPFMLTRQLLTFLYFFCVLAYL